MTVKVLYLNDTKQTQWVSKVDFMGAAIELAPQAHTVIELAVADDQAVFVKTWGTRVLISVTDLP